MKGDVSQGGVNLLGKIIAMLIVGCEVINLSRKQKIDVH